jgi:hypothetical protein
MTTKNKIIEFWLVDVTHDTAPALGISNQPSKKTGVHLDTLLDPTKVQKIRRRK